MSIEDYISNWDTRINEWMKSPMNYSDVYLKALPNAFQIEYMPEPYLGNPNDCSFVIVNLNAGQGRCHSWHALRAIDGTMINAISNNNSYSKIALLFPYLKECTLFKNWNSYEACRWWKERELWLKNVYQSFGENYNSNCKMPFAIEMCAWHSIKWPTNFVKEQINNNDLKKEVEMTTFVISKAIEESVFKFAYSVGKPIGNMLKELGFSNEIELSYEKCNDGYLPDSEIKRYYRILYDEKGHCIVNTWSRGSNKYPSNEFYNCEKVFYQKIIKNISK